MVNKEQNDKPSVASKDAQSTEPSLPKNITVEVKEENQDTSNSSL
jgi:hypothetical protein